MKWKITFLLLLISFFGNGQEIDIVRASSIASNGTYGFGNVVSGASTTVTFTIRNTLNATTLILDGPPVVELAGPDAALFTVNETGILTTLSGISSTTFTITFSPTTTGLKTASFTISNNDSNEGTYVVNLTGTGISTNTSAVIIDPGYVYPTNIAYQNHQATDIANSSTSIEVGSFILRDGNGTNDADNLPTTLTDITFSLPLWANIRSVALYDGATEVGGDEDGAATVTFNGLNLTAPDNGTKAFTIRVSYNETVTDGAIPQFIVSSATALAGGSAFIYADARTGSNANTAARTSAATPNNRIEVIATKLDFLNGPSDTDTFVAMPTVTVQALDNLGNRDTGYTATVILTSTGTFNTVGLPINDPDVNAASGVANFTSVVHSIAGTGFTLTASSGSLATDTSSSFDIGPASGASNFFRSRTSGDWNTPSSWETSHNNIDSWITSTLAPTNASRGIRILNGHTMTCTTTTTADQMVIDAGGTLVLDTGANFTLSNGSGTDLTVSGTFTYANGTFNRVGTIAFSATGVYNHAIPSATLTLPIAAWNAASTCNVTGLNNAAAIVGTNMNQTFGIFNWNNPNQTGYVAVNHAGFKVATTLNIGTATANANNVLCLSDSGTFTNAIKTININGGKLIAAQGTGSSTMTITGATTIAGGELIGSQGSGTATLNTSTTFTISSGKFILINSANSGNVNFTLSANNRTFTVTGTGALLLENTSSASGIATLTVNQDFICSSTATPAVDFGTGTVTDNAINIKRNLTKTDSGTFATSAATSAKGFVFFNSVSQAFNYTGANSSAISYTVNSGAILTMGSDLTFGTASGPESIFTVQNGGRLNLGTRIITGNATHSRVNIESGATLSSSNTGGLGGTGALGSFQGFAGVNTTPATGRLSLPAGIHYVLGGATTTPFPVGAGIAFGNPATLTTSANITSNMTSALTITNAFTVSSNTFKLNTAGNNLILNNAVLTITGTFDNNGENQITGSGSPSIIINGKFITRDIQGFTGANTAIPVLVPALGPSSTVEYALTGNQAVQATPAYKNLTLSGSGTKTLNGNTTATKITVTNATFETQNFTAGDATTALTMTGTGIYRTSGTGIKPDAGATYSLSYNSTVEFYGSNPMEIRLGVPAISYGRIIVNGTNVTANSATTGIQFVATNSAFTVKTGATFKFKNTDGFTGGTATALSNTAINPVLENGSTIEYAGANQSITPYNIGSTTSYKKVKVSGTGIKTLSSDVLIREDLNVAESLLKVENNRTLTVTNGVTTVDTTPTDGILVENNGSLLQITPVDNLLSNANLGAIQVQRTTQDMYRYDYTYWGSPVKACTLGTLSPDTLGDKYMSWNAAGSAWVIHYGGADEMAAGKGYAIRAPQTFSTNPAIKVPYTGTFTGVPNNGTVTFATHGNGVLTPERYNLLGNPYPSAIDTDLFLQANSTKLEGTIYLWTHQTAASGNQYSGSDYLAYNLSGGIGSAGRYLATGQGFFVKGISAAASTVTFNNTMRVGGNNSNFLKPGTTTPVENWELTGQHRIWLNLSNSQGAFNQTLVGYIQGATDGLDWGYDGEQFGGNTVSFYSLLEDQDMSIQGKALPFSNQDEVPLGYSTTAAGALTIAIDHFDGLFEGQDIYLEDLVLDVVHDLKDSNYTFNSLQGTFEERFILRYVPSETLTAPDYENSANTLLVYKSNNQIMVKSQLESLQNIAVYDLLGRVIFETKNIGTNAYAISNVALNEQPLIVKTKLLNGQVVNKKIVF